MPLLNQVLAAEKGVKTRAESRLTEAYQQLAKSELLSGISKAYRPKDEDGDALPSESKRVQLHADRAILEVTDELIELFNLTLTKDRANCEAAADIVVDGKVLAEQVPVTTLLFLEKKLVDLRTFFAKLPTLDPAEDWVWHTQQDCWVSAARDTHRTQKITKPLVLAPATDKHPAQVNLVHEDIIAGYWTTIKFSGAMPIARVRKLTQRVEQLQRAVKEAREAANSRQVQNQEFAKEIFDYLLAR